MLNVVMLNVIMLNVVRLNIVGLNVIRLNVVRLNVVGLNVVGLNFVMLNVVRLNVVRLNVVRLNVVSLYVKAPLKVIPIDRLAQFFSKVVFTRAKFSAKPQATATCDVLLLGSVTQSICVESPKVAMASRGILHVLVIEKDQSTHPLLFWFFPHLNMQKPADYGPQQH
jgi:hypothetical protein